MDNRSVFFFKKPRQFTESKKLKEKIKFVENHDRLRSEGTRYFRFLFVFLRGSSTVVVKPVDSVV